ncbi:MAG: MGMT family protein [Candidatus Nanoarchaeia archaeon]|nr:MGMT family protein [Candidatus Nanoarchaeia archaeon]
MKEEDVFKLLKQVPYGKVTTYGDLARKLNSKAFRVIGVIMHRNKDPENIPCFKIVKSNGELGGYASGVDEKIKRLNREGIEVINGKIDLEKYLYKFE